MAASFNPAKDIPDLSGKVIVVTGGNAGLGAKTVRELAQHNPKTIYLCARDTSKAEAFVASLNTSTTIKPIHFDLSSLKSARTAAREIVSSTDRIDLLYLNAGVAGVVPSLTQEGYEWHMGVNHLAHAAFTQSLLPLLRQTAAQPNSDVRIIHIASEAAKLFALKNEGIVFSALQTDMASYKPLQCYGQSKLANILFAKKLAELYPELKSIPVHPGLVNTENYSKGTGVGWFKLMWKAALMLVGLTAEEGVKTQLWAATAHDAKSGMFYVPVGKEDDGGKFGRDVKLRNELWAWTERELKKHDASAEWPKST